MKGDALLNFLVGNGKGSFTAHGSVASRLLNNGLDIKAMRTNDVLLYDEWKAIDKAVLAAYQQRLVGVADLQARGLTYTIPNGLGKPVFAYQDASDAEDAEMAMDGKTRGRRDRQEFDINYMPMPLIFADFSFNIRELEASRSGSMPLDTSMATLKARKVAEKVEEILFQGASTYTFGGGSIYGYEDEPNRNTGSLTAPWNDSAASGTTILGDVRDMKQALIDDRAYGSYVLYVPTQYETALDDDFKANSDKSIRQRLLEVDGLAGIKIADKASSTKVSLVQMTEDVIRLVTGLDIITVQWDTDGGMQVNFKIMTIQIPQTRHDQSGRCGIAVFTE